MTVAATAVDDLGFHTRPLVRKDLCQEHGEFEARCYCRNIWTACPICARERDAHQNAKDEAKRKAAAVENWQQRVGTAGIPERFRDRTLAAYIAETDQQRRALDFAKRYADAFSQVLQTGRSAIFYWATRYWQDPSSGWHRVGGHAALERHGAVHHHPASDPED